MKRVVMCGGLVAALAGGMGIAGRVIPPHLARAAEASKAGRSICQNIQLLVRYQNSNGAAGHISVVYRVHNLWSSPCTLAGYPGLQLLGQQFKSLPTTVHRGGAFLGGIPTQTVGLAGNGDAYFTLVYSDVPVGNRPCQSPASYLMVIAPNNRLPVVTYAVPQGAMNSCTGDLDVSPVTARPRLP